MLEGHQRLNSLSQHAKHEVHGASSTNPRYTAPLRNTHAHPGLSAAAFWLFALTYGGALYLSFFTPFLNLGWIYDNYLPVSTDATCWHNLVDTFLVHGAFTQDTKCPHFSGAWGSGVASQQQAMAQNSQKDKRRLRLTQTTQPASSQG